MLIYSNNVCTLHIYSKRYYVIAIYSDNVCTLHVHSKRYYVIAIYMCIERSVNISITRITRVNNVCFCYVAINDDISTYANFQVDGYHGC